MPFARESRPLGDTGLDVTALSFGSAPLATVFWENDEATAVEAAAAALQSGIGLVDTAPFYGLGEAEERLGMALTSTGRTDVVVATKVGRTLIDHDGDRDVAFDFSADAIRRQLDASLGRLGRDRVDIVHVHDPEDHLDQALEEAFPTLAQLRAEGSIGAVSVGTNVCATVQRVLAEADPDVVMLAGRLTLLDQSATETVLPRCAARGIPLLAAGVFNSGVLADPTPGRWYDYAPASQELLDRARHIGETCQAHGVPLRTAAMAYPLRFAEVASIVVGMATASEVEENLVALDRDVPDALWHELGL